MIGGGETPFSPTPWIFDAGALTGTYGLYCVAGTTEFDEENGIGLVLYVADGNNVILWDMQTGAKESSTFPFSGDDINMLKAAYQAKTGETIGYTILHPTTEDSIDIEDYIVINQ